MTMGGLSYLLTREAVTIKKVVKITLIEKRLIQEFNGEMLVLEGS